MTDELDLAAQFDAAATDPEPDAAVLAEIEAEAAEAELAEQREGAIAAERLQGAFDATVRQRLLNMVAQRHAEEKLSAATRRSLGDVYQTAADVSAAAEDGVDFVVPRVLVRDGLTVIGGSPKDGKSHLAIVGLVGPLERGEPTVFGDAYAEPVTTLVVSEEPITLFGEKAEIAGIDRYGFIDGSRISGLTWDDKVAVIIEKAVEHGHGLIFGDNLRRLAGANAAQENSSDLGFMVETLADQARAAGVSVLLLHHLRKTEGSVMERLRGGTALPGAADVLLAVERVGTLSDRRRRITGYGRPAALGGGYSLGVELSEDGTTYRQTAVSGDGDGDREDVSWQRITIEAERLSRLGRAVTAEEFRDAINRESGVRPIQTRAAMNRLNALVDAERATRDTTSTPYTWTARAAAERVVAALY